MAQIPSRYLSGMRAFEAFHELLYPCMRDALPGAALSKSGAFVWRGYRIREYKTLAQGHYYVLTWPHAPEHLTLTEEYRDRKGRLHKPFVLRLNLRESRFFMLDPGEQRAFLTTFICGAAQQALMWQASRASASGSTTDLRGSIQVDRYTCTRPDDWRYVREDYFAAMPLQNQLFEMLTHAIRSVAKKLNPLPEDPVYFQPNASIHNWAYRGLRMKLRETGVIVPRGPFPYRWNIYYDAPAVICLERYDGKHPRPFKRLDLDQEGFFDLDEDAQQEALERFAHRAFGDMEM